MSLSYLFSPFLYLRTFLFLSKTKKKNNFRILLMQTAKIGDMVNTTPVFREIKKRHPNSYLVVLIISKAKGIIADNSRIDKIIVLDQKRYNGLKGKLNLLKDLGKDKFNVSVSLTPTLLNNILPLWLGIPKRISFISEYVPKSVRWSFIFTNYKKEFLRARIAFWQFLDILEFLGIKNPDKSKELFISEESRENALNFLFKNGILKNDFLVGISVSSGNPIKDWDLEKFAELADKLIENFNAKMIFIGSSEDRELVNSTIGFMKKSAVNAAGEFILEYLSALMEHFKLFISVDTGPLYIANALDVPLVNIAGPCDVSKILDLNDLNNKCEVVYKKLDCSPCTHIFPAVYVCKEGHFRCTKDISVIDVYEAVLKLREKYDF